MCRLLAIAALVVPLSLEGQIEPGALVRKDALLSTLPPDSLYPQPREVVRARTGRLSTMVVRLVAGDPSSGRLLHREAFMALHNRAGRRSFEPYDRGIVAVREDSLFRVVYVAEIDPGLGYVESMKTFAPPGSRSGMHVLHVRYAQTGSGGVTEDLLFALDADNRLVEVPIVQPDLDHLLEDGEYMCCGSFTSFDEDLIEQTVYVTRDGRRGVTHRIRSRFRLEGAFELDDEIEAYVPSFRLVATKTTGREPR